MLDEGAALVDRLLRGERVEHAGPHYVVRGGGIGPRPVQQPRPPIWVGGMKPGALRRASRWDGWIALAVDEAGAMTLSPEALGDMVRTIGELRTTEAPGARTCDVAVFAVSEPDGTGHVARFAAAGATWWLESLSPMRGSMDALLARVAAGPPSSA
jgi:alkanesulfonate monooxygenase SsuD/methylene tetrahydromethanopterin reductase-like flavin-dependent oxidoreductase (luciferase family)